MVYATFTLLNNQPESTRSRSRALYDDDLYAWALEQAALIEAGRFSELDVVNLADEVADVARREVHQLESRLSRVLQHLLKWDYQKERRAASWARSIREQRRRVSRLLKDSPSLTNRVDALLKEAYTQGRVAALNESNLPDHMIPEANPYSWDEIMTRPVSWPEP